MRGAKDFSVPVGEAEQHTVRFTRSPWLGKIRIAIDGVPAVRRVEMFSFKTSKRFEVSVGTSEVHEVAFVKTRPLFVAGFRDQRVEALVDGVAVGRF